MPDLSTIGNIALAALGISFLIFFHELGHFLAARLFHVRVEVFSIGFGPRLVRFRRDDTDYCVSAIPLGGYVKMAGEYGDVSDDHVPDPGDLTAKPAWQRAIVFSGGVLMNVLLAFLLLPVAFSLGVPFTAPVVGVVDSGGAAWSAGVRPGDEILEVNGRHVYGFEDVGMEVTLGDAERTTLRIRRAGQEFDLALTPQRSESRGLVDIGIRPADNRRIAVTPDSPAAAAGLATHDELLGVNGVRLTPSVPLGQLLGRSGVVDGRPLELTYARDGVENTAMVAPRRRENSDHTRLGTLPATTRITGLRGAASAPGFPLRSGDVIREVDGRPVFDSQALLEILRQDEPDTVHLQLLRDDATHTVVLDRKAREAVFADDIAFGPDFSGRTIQVLADGALQRAGLADGDEILALDGKAVPTYAHLRDRVHAADAQRWAVTYRRGDGEPVTVAIIPRPIVTWDYGFTPQVLEVVHREGLPGAVRAGMECSLNALRTTWLTLSRLITGDVAARNVGGIVAISELTYRFATWGVAKLLFLLAVLSVNLAFVNILPIPVLDGGQLMILGFEMIKGSRLSESFLQRMQMAGMVAILALVLYVTYNDILRLVG